MPVEPPATPGCAALVVGIDAAGALTRHCRESALVTLPPDRLCPGLVAGLNPRCIVLPLFAARTDAAELLDRLAGMPFAGRILILAPPLPRRDMVLAELQARAPGLRLHLLMQRAP